MGDAWPDEVKISLLRGTLNQTLRIALANNHLIPDDEFSEFVRIVSKFSQQFEEIVKAPHEGQHFRLASAKQTSTNSTHDTVYDREERNSVGNLDGAGDTIMSGVNMANVIRGPSEKPLRAK